MTIGLLLDLAAPLEGMKCHVEFSKGCAVEGDIILDVAVTGDGDTFLFAPPFA